MTTVIGVRFKKAGKVYYFDPTGVWPNPGDLVIVETSRGIEMGEVITGSREVDSERIMSPLKPVIRQATQEDIRIFEANRQLEERAFGICEQRIEKHHLEMKLVDVEYTFDGSKIVFYFTADGRVDFRELVRDLASTFKMRIELRQIGVRDEAKLLGGLGPCGRPICCGSFLSDFQPVSIKMAKEQNLSLNPTKISGQCGRLMCCLSYEKDTYEEALKKLPKLGKPCMTPDGIGYLSDVNVIRERVKVRIHNQDDSYEFREYRLDEVSKPDPALRIELPKRQEKNPKQEETKAATDASDGKEEKSARRRTLRGKKNKQLSTDEYFENLGMPRTEEPSQEGAQEAQPE